MNESYSNYKHQIKAFVEEVVPAYTDQLEDQQIIPKELIQKISEKGLFGASIKQIYGGLGLSPFELMALHEEMARGNGSVENMLTVTSMVAVPIQRFGTKEQREKWLPLISSGKKLSAIALTEPNAGSALRDVELKVTETDDGLVLNGTKRWITLGQIADVFLVLCSLNSGTAAILVERDTPGLTIKPINNMLGFRANSLAELDFSNCIVPKANMLGKETNGISTAIIFGLDEGRFTTACGSLGIASAALDIALTHVKSKVDRLGEYQLVLKLLTEMIVSVESARNFCFQAATARNDFDYSMIKKTLLAKYTASTAATSVSSKGVQVLGASGCHRDSGMERLFRDAKIMEIIEGTTQVHEIQIAKEFLTS